MCVQLLFIATFFQEEGIKVKVKVTLEGIKFTWKFRLEKLNFWG